MNVKKEEPSRSNHLSHVSNSTHERLSHCSTHKLTHERYIVTTLSYRKALWSGGNLILNSSKEVQGFMILSSRITRSPTASEECISDYSIYIYTINIFI